MSLDDLFALERGDETPIGSLIVYCVNGGEAQIDLLRDGRVRWRFLDGLDLDTVDLLRANGHAVELGGVR